MIIGLGCTVDDPMMPLWHERLVELSGASREDVFLECNKSTAKMLKNIAKTVCAIRPSSKDSFVDSIYRKILRYRNTSTRILLLGSSYGGSVAGRVASLFNDDPVMAPRLSVATFGSIHIPKPDRVSRISLVNFMFPGDVALKCNGLKTPARVPSYDAVQKIIWLPVPGQLTKGWDIHTAYSSIIDRVVQTKNPSAGFITTTK